MSRFLPFLLLIILGLVSHVVGSWWWFAVLAFIIGLAFKRKVPGTMFWSGLFAGLTIWSLGALWYGSGEGSLPEGIAELFGLPNETALLCVVSMVGALTGGIFILLGAYARRILINPSPSNA